MNILLTGGAGYIGSHVAIALFAAGHNIFIYDNFCNSYREIIGNLEKILQKKVVFTEGDIRNSALLEDFISKNKIESVIHFAGLKAVDESVKSPLLYYENNVLGTLSLLKAMSNQGVKNLVFSSSATVYGDPAYLPIDEAHPLAPTNAYGRTKLYVEQILADLVNADPEWKVLSLRYFNPVGSHSSGLLGDSPQGRPNNLMPFIAKVASGEIARLRVFGNKYLTIDGTGVRDYIHIMDLAEGHAAAISFLPCTDGFEALNLGCGIGYSVIQMIQAYELISNKKIPYEIADNRPGDVASCYALAKKANKILSWKASRTLEDMCMSSWVFQCKRRGSVQ